MNSTNRGWLIVARILLASLFIVAAIRKLMIYSGMVGYFGHIGFPLPEVVLPLVIALELGGGIALIAGWRLQWVAMVMGLYTLAAAFIGHKFWISSPAEFNNTLYNFFKNVSIAGGFLLLVLNANHSPTEDGRD